MHGKTYGCPPGMRHAVHTLSADDVSSLPERRIKGKERYWFESMKLKVFTQTAAVSLEVGGLQHSRPTGSSSQTKSVEETVKGRNSI